MTSQSVRAYTIRTLGEAFGIGKTTIFPEIAAGRLEARKAGGRTARGVRACQHRSGPELGLVARPAYANSHKSIVKNKGPQDADRL